MRAVDRSSRAHGADVEWAGVPFLSLFHHDARMLRVPGLFGFVHRDDEAGRTLLFVGHGDSLATAATSAHPTWIAALGLGMNEVHVNLQAQERVDRLQLCAHIARRCAPLLNLLEEVSPAAPRVAARRPSVAVA